MKKKILIVDDEKDILALLGKRLSSSGYDVIKAENGKDAIVMAKNQSPDLIILDILMPGMDGSQTADILKNDATTKNIPIIFLTCLVTKDEEKEEHVRGGTYYIAKPYNPDEILNAVKQHLKA